MFDVNTTGITYVEKYFYRRASYGGNKFSLQNIMSCIRGDEMLCHESCDVSIALKYVTQKNSSIIYKEFLALLPALSVFGKDKLPP